VESVILDTDMVIGGHESLLSVAAFWLVRTRLSSWLSLVRQPSPRSLAAGGSPILVAL